MNFKSPCFPIFLLPFPWASPRVSESRKWDTFSNKIASLFTKQGYLELFWCFGFFFFWVESLENFSVCWTWSSEIPFHSYFMNHVSCWHLKCSVCFTLKEFLRRRISACSFERLTGHMGHQLCPTATRKPLLSAQLCTASNKIKERGRN